SGGATLGLMISAPLSDALAAAAGGSATGETMTFNPFVMISPDGTVTVLSKHLDKGQGTLSGLASLVAEELDADWAQMKGDFAPSNPALYNNKAWGPYQGTGGSTGIANSFMQYREAGATARAMLVEAAAQEWAVPASEITIEAGVLSHPSGKTGGFGDFAAAASALPVPTDVPLKDPADFKLIGKLNHKRLDTTSKSDGSAMFTQDIHLPNMLTAVIAHAPKFGATVASYDDSAARAIPGVEEVVQVPQGIAVLARNTWTAMQGREALSIEWDESAAETRSSAQMLEEYRVLADQPGIVAEDIGDANAALASAETVLEATFEFPFLAHAPMEPMNAVADLKPGQSLEVWTGSQLQTLDHHVAATIAGLEMDKVQIHTVFAGGSFGRRATPSADFVSEAVAIAVAINGRAPVKLVWSREDDIQGGYYRPLYVHKIKAGLDGDGNIVGIHHRIVGQSILSGTPFEAMISPDGVDATSVEGAKELPYAVGAHRLEVHNTKVGVPPLWWRAVGSTHTAYVVETMMDRLAKAAGVDPLEFRLRNMANHPREAGALRLAAEKAGYGTKQLPEGVYQGIAVHKSFGSYVAQVAEVRMDDSGEVEKVERVVCAIDCGLAVMPDQVAAQLEGGVGYGLGAVLRNQITLTDGAVDQSQFYDYEPLRISEMPIVESHIVPSAEPPTGTGEPGLPPLAPAIANAVFQGSGREMNMLPFTENGQV
ncbi:MAG: molybdopterin cofactor-binding domain-containing protein, partial [Rhodospirillaceae bacterium]